MKEELNEMVVKILEVQKSLDEFTLKEIKTNAGFTEFAQLKSYVFVLNKDLQSL